METTHTQYNCTILYYLGVQRSDPLAQARREKLLKSLPVGASPLVVTNARRPTPEGY